MRIFAGTVRGWALLSILGVAEGGCHKDDAPAPVVGGLQGDAGGDDAHTDASTARDATLAPAPAPAIGALPCNVEAVLRARCQTCHGRPTAFGAPMALLTLADTQGRAVTGAAPVSDLMKQKVSAGLMPPQATPTGALTATDKATLLDWLNAGTPAAAKSCAPPADGGLTGDAQPAPVGPEALPCKPQYEFRAQGDTAKDPFVVPQVNDTYKCFPFPSPFTATEQGTAWAPILDDTRVIHHWILYANSGTTKPNGCNDPGRTFLTGWAPGGQNYIMPADVGLDLPSPGSWLTLEVHYNNRAHYADARDRSGVALCTTQTPRAQEAGVITLGSAAITLPPGTDNLAVTGVCPALATAMLPEALHVLSSFPHMHQLGKSFRTDIVRAGVTSNLVDVPVWDFNNQRGYPQDPQKVFLRPGDELRTTCVYRNDTNATVRFGGATENEMCFNFVLAYPITRVAVRTCVLN